MERVPTAPDSDSHSAVTFRSLFAATPPAPIGEGRRAGTNHGNCLERGGLATAVTGVVAVIAWPAWHHVLPIPRKGQGEYDPAAIGTSSTATRITCHIPRTGGRGRRFGRSHANHISSRRCEVGVGVMPSRTAPAAPIKSVDQTVRLLADDAREIERDSHCRFTDVACRHSGDLVEPVDDGVAVDGEPPRGQHEIETAFTPGDERVL